MDTDAINQAIAACDEVVLTNGTFLSGSLRLRSNVVLNVQAGAQLLGAPNDVHAYDPVLPNPWDQYQDYGHSHWRDALIWGQNVTNVTIKGFGTIDGGGIVAHQPPPGGGCKLLGLVNSSNIVLTQVTLRNTGWFALLATNIDNLTITDMQVHATRDGLDIVGCRHVRSAKKKKWRKKKKKGERRKREKEEQERGKTRRKGGSKKS